MKKRITSLLLTLVMLLSLVPAMGVTALAASGAGTAGDPRVVTTYEEWKAAMQQSGETYIKLGNDIDTSTMNHGYGLGADDWVLVQANIHLNLNGHKLTLMKSKLSNNHPASFIVVTSGNLIIEDTGSGGEIVGVHKATRDTMDMILVSNGAKLTLNSGKLALTMDEADRTANGSSTIKSMGTVEINDGTVAISCKGSRDERGTNLEAQEFALLIYGNAVINGGTFDGRVLLTAVAKAPGVADNVITGGDFKKSIYFRKDKAVTGDVPLNVSIQGGTYHYTPGYYQSSDGEKVSDPNRYVQFPTVGFTTNAVYDGPVYSTNNGDYFDKFDMTAFASMFPQNVIISATGQKYEHIDSWGDTQTIDVKDAVYTGSSSLRDLAHLLTSHYKTITVTTLPSDALKDMKLTVGDGAPLPAQGTSTVSGDVTLGSDGTLTKTVYITALGNKQLKEMYYSNPSKIDFGYRLNIFKNGTPVTDYTGDSLTYAALGDEISVSVQLRDFEFEEGVYTFRLALWPYLRGSEAQIGENLVGLWKLTAKEEPPAPVAHSIKIINGFGTANPTTAIAGETVTVKANDRTADNMMFTQWYTETAGVTFANATQRETTFVMPDCDVKVSPGYHGVSFTKQPVPQISLEQGYGGKTSFAFSWDISEWELVDTATNQTVSSGDTPVKAGKLTDVTIPKNTELGHKTYRIVVTTANGEQFKSNDFIVTWFETMPAPLVEFSIPSDTKFIGELTVNVGCPSTLETGGASPFETCYTTNGVDPKNADPSDIQRYYGYTDVTLTKTTHFMARTILEGEGGNEDTWGELCEATYTMIDKLDAPTVTPESCSYSGSLPIIVTIQDVYNAKIDYSVKQHDGYLSGGDEPGPMLETGLSDTFCGTTTFSAKAIVYKDGGGAWESDEVTYTYTREYWANISNATISGKVNEAIAATDVTITLDGEKFKNVAVGDDVSGWFNLPAGLTAKVKEQTSYSRGLVITISGTPTATSADAITVTIPKDKLLANGTVDLTVLSNPKAVYNIVEDGTHTHTYSDWTMLDDSQHSRSCTCGDVQFEAHDFNAWTPNSDDTTHSRTCSKCKKSGETEFYTETAEHNWQWKVDTAATPNAPGKQHEECVDCHAKRNENTPISMLTSIMVENLTVAKPVKDAAAAKATTTDNAYYVANTEWTAADGTPLAIGGKFQPGTVYTAKITLETAGAGVFSAKSTYNDIEGKKATVSPDLTGNDYADSVELTYTFDKTAGGYHPGTGTGTGVTTYAITVKSAKNGDVTASHKTASKGTTVTLTVDPDKGYVLDTLTVLDGKDKEIKLTEKNGKFTFTMPASKVTVAATFKASAPTGKNPFIDVPAGSYYEDAVVWAVEKGITSGTSAVTFDPNGNCTRAQAVTFLWRAAGSPAPKTKGMPFTDVPSGSYYYDAVLWAMEQGITKGTSDTAFSPNASCTRAQIVTFLWRANGSPAVSGNSAFTDVASDAYYAAAVTWAEKNGVTGGIGGGLFGSNNNCTRAQIVTFLYRAMK